MLNIQLIECLNCGEQYSADNDACTHCGRPRYAYLDIKSLSLESAHKGLSMQSSNKVSCDGYTFDSTLEFHRYEVLKIRSMLNLITDLQVHPKFILLPKIPKVVSAITYEADFSYMLGDKLICEDVKAVYGNTKKNRAKGIAGKAIIKADARLRHKMLLAKLWHEYGDKAEFRIVTEIGE